MSALAAMKAADAKLKQCQADVRDLRIQISSRRSAADKRKAQLAADTQLVMEYEISLGAGDVLAALPPSGDDLAKLKREVEIDGPVLERLKSKIEAAEAEEKKKKEEFGKATSDYIHEHTITPALDEVHNAWNTLAWALINLMAAHRVAEESYRSTRGYYNALEPYGPAAEFIGALHHTAFETYPYSVKPAWLLEHGQWHPERFAGVIDRRRELQEELRAAVNA
ncbi:hypothetical protein HL653_02645 [Sphingomonas sp. AP4-R1]|uniref:hypothetical protein n=1 Tax=Sphingomonas sp. AP4-R1 TaxID=2735134 RepID=UPI0014938CAD|nr:hypothetical protein [Sphingomonas sp. AP4-R1]QJU56833.1 hypothetical protein HL653_02645 [Sphingomonas sp. AP4-R1]